MRVLRSNANGEVTVVACGGNASNSRDGFEHKFWGKMSVAAEMSQKDEKIIMVHVSALGSDGPKVSEIAVLHNLCGVCA
ncbi:unnamed protein product [Sphagnum balticum]